MSRFLPFNSTEKQSKVWDRDFLMNVRNHKFEYDEIIDLLEEEKERMNQLMEQSTIREEIDTDFVNQLMIDIRNAQLKIMNR